MTLNSQTRSVYTDHDYFYNDQILFVFPINKGLEVIFFLGYANTDFNKLSKIVETQSGST